MELKKLIDILIAAVQEIQEMSGRSCGNLNSHTCPLLDVDGFDSLNGVEATIDIAGKLGKDFDFNNVFVDGSNALSIEAAAKRIQAIVVPLESEEH